MNILISPGVPPLVITRSCESQIDRNSHSLTPAAALSHSFRSSTGRKTWKLYATAKGFGKSVGTQRTNEITKRNENNNNNDDDDDKISQEVWDRMIVRILFYVGTPMGTGVALLYVLDALKNQKIWDVPLWLPFLTTLLAFGTSTLGIAYGTLSTSLDPDKKGSLLGWEEVQQNWPELWKEENDNRRQ